MTEKRVSMPDRMPRVRAGLLVPSSNTVMEVDLYRNLPPNITVHAARMYLEETTREAEIEMIENFAPRAAALLGTAKPHFMIFGCTSAGSLGGSESDKEICSRISRITGVPTVGVYSSVREALLRSKVKSVAVITPYIEDINISIREGLERDGLHVAAIHGMGIDVNFNLATPTPEEIVDFSSEKLGGIEADMLFISCTNFRAMEAIPSLKKKLGIPVITSNTATIDAVLDRVSRMTVSESENFNDACQRKFQEPI
jgi:maleate isomerase